MQRGEQPMATHQAPGSSSAWAQKYSVEATPLGRGSFATVHKAIIRETEESVAIKVMTKARLGERALQMLAAEINILRTLQHPNVVCLRDSHTTERRILIVLEYCGGGDLGQFIQARGPSPEPTARHFMGQLAAGLAFLRSRRLIHRDIKPQNLLLTERTPRARLKIADFGLARHLPQGSLAESMLGSPLYMAPEVLSSRAYDAKADLWSAGAVLFELLTAKHPFGGANQTELINNIRRNRPRLPSGIKLSASCIELLGMLLVPRPADRASLQMVLSCVFLNEKDEINNKEPTSAHRSGVELASPARAAAMGRAPQSSPPSHVPPSAAAPSTADNPRSFSHTNRDGFSPEKYRLTPQPGEPTLSRPSAQWRADGATRAGHLEGRRRGESIGHQTAEMAPTVREDGVEGPRKVPGKLAANVEPRSSVAAKAAPQQRGNSGTGEHQSAADSRRIAAWGWSWESRTRGQDKDVEGVSMLAGINDEGPLPSLPALPFALQGPNGRQFAPGNPAPAVHRGSPGDRGAIQAASDLVFDLAFAASPAEHLKMQAQDVENQERQSVGANDAAVMATPSLEPCGPERNRRHPRRDDPAAHANASFSGASAGAGAQVMQSRRRDRFSGEDPVSSPDSKSPPAVRDDGLTRSSSPHSPDAISSAGRGGSPGAPRASRASYGSISPSPRVIPESPPVRLSAGAAVGYVGGQAEGSTPLSPGHYAGRGSGVRCDARTTLSDLGSGGGAHLSPPRVPSKGLHGRQYHATPVVAGSQQHSPGSPSSEFVHPQATVGGVVPEMRGADGVPMVLQYPSLRAGGDSLLTIPEDSTGFVLVTRPSSMACEHGPQCDCMAWSAGGGGVASAGGGLARSPSASYLAAANPYGGPGKASASAERRQRTGGGGNAAGPSFLGLGNIWTTAVNTFRGVAGANPRRNSWPRRGGHVNGQRPQQQHHQQQQHHEQASAFASVPPSPTPSVPGLYSPSASPTAVVGSLREHLSPHGAQGVRKMAGARASDVGVGTGSPGNGSSSSGGNDSPARQDGDGGAAGGSSRREMAAPSPSASSHRNAGTSTAEFTMPDASSASPPDVESGRVMQYVRPRSQSVDQQQQWRHHRRHSEPVYSPLGERPTSRQSQMFNVQGERVAPSSRSQGLEGATAGGLGRLRWNHDEVLELRRVQVAAERAEVVGTRSILLVKLADKTAQEAMSLALESPRDARASESDASPGDGASHDICLGRRHEMLTEALSLYVRALAMLQGALPGVLVECEGVSTEGLAAWNPLGTVAKDQRRPDQQQHQQQQQKQHGYQHQEQHKQDQQGPLHSKSPSSALLAQRSELVAKASRLKELFTQTLQRAEQCNDKIKAAAAALAAQGSCPVPSSGDDGAFATAGTGHGVLWATLGSAGMGFGGPGMPSSDIAAAAVYRSAVEHGREAAVCYLLGRSDAAVEYYGRARALLQLLALEPEMAGAGARAGGQKDGPLDGSPGSFSNAKSGWRAQLLLMADGYARRVELMNRGADVEGIEERVQQGGGRGEKTTGL